MYKEAGVYVQSRAKDLRWKGLVVRFAHGALSTLSLNTSVGRTS